MISVQEASTIILSNLFTPVLKSVSLNEAVGKILGEDILADRDFPPFDRVTMDGIALEFKAFREGKRKFLVENVQAAGEPRKKLNDRGNVIEVMTGAMLPEGTDTVIRYEDLAIAAPYVTIINEEIDAYQSIHRQGQDAKKDTVLLSPGIILSPAEIALLASVGKSEVRIKNFPRAAIIASGDELVDINATPLPHQIRRSNTYAIQSAMSAMGWVGEQFHLPDEKTALMKSIEKMLAQFDMLILSGGVSQGKFDFIPSVMEDLGVKKLFHQVSQRPGKPFWFGVSKEGKTVFALPGNPVSTFMCFYRFIKPWVLKSLSVEVKNSQAILAKDFSFKPKLTYFLQVAIENEGGKLIAFPDAGGGSGDFANLKKIDGFLELPMEKTEFKAGEPYPFIPFRG